MAHPKKKAGTSTTCGFKHTTIPVIVDELCPTGELLDIPSLTEPLANKLIEVGSSLCTLHSKIMLSSLVVLWPN